MSSVQPKSKILVVECARGFAAMYVLFHHVKNIGGLDGLFPGAKFALHALDFGQQMVFLFFFLSGFSIHYSSRDRQLGGQSDCLQYFYLRFRRIYPLFLLSVGMTLLLSLVTLSFDPGNLNLTLPDSRLIGTLFFMSDIHDGRLVAAPQTNPALWSLSYEVVYYAIYPLFWRVYKFAGVEKTFLATVLFSSAFAGIGLVVPNHLSNVISLYWLWGAGALLAEWRITGKMLRVEPALFYSLLFVVFCTSRSLARTAPPVFYCWSEGLFIGLIMVAYCLDFGEVTRRRKVIGVAAILLLLLAVIRTTQNLPVLGRHVFLDLSFALFALVLIVLIGGGIDIRRCCTALLRPFLRAGAWSYALYIIHMPIIYFVGSVFQKKYPHIIATLIAAPVICWLAMLLELKLQPWFAMKLDACWARMKTALVAASAA